MNVLQVLLFFVYLLFSSFGIILVKMGAAENAIEINTYIFNVRFSIVSLFGIGLYVISFILWMYILHKYNASFIMPIATGLGICLVTSLSYFILKESVSKFQVAGIIVVIIGVLLINYKR